MTWEWISDQAVPIVMVFLFLYGLRNGEIYTKTSYGLVVDARDEAREERDVAIDKLDTITREQAEAQAEERTAMAARIATLETQLADMHKGRGPRQLKGAP